MNERQKFIILAYERAHSSCETIYKDTSSTFKYKENCTRTMFELIISISKSFDKLKN